MLHRGGTVAHANGPLRAALDAALSSPSRRGVIVDDSGALVGTVRAHEVLTAIEQAQRPELEDPATPGAAASAP
jgi:osmoprotectant transport system ATP-binding protein